MNQSLLSFEQAQVNAELAAKQATLDARAAKKEAKQAKTDEWRRKMAANRNYRTPDEHAQCGIRWYCRSPKDRDTGCYWRTCHACGQPLIYTSDPNAKPQECKPCK
jgi:hypothetical protein